MPQRREKKFTFLVIILNDFCFISANISFIIGRYFGSTPIGRLGLKIRMFQQIERKFQKSGFLSVLTVRLMFVPFDLVGYSSGAFNI